MDDRGTPNRWTLIRDMIVFQFKLLVDGFRDLVLVPVSLVIGMISLFRSGRQPGPEFYELMRYGRYTDRAINLFGAAERLQDPEDPEPFDEARVPDIDTLVERVEGFVVEEYHRGGITTQAKERLDQALDAINRRHGKRGTGASEPEPADEPSESPP